MIRKNKEQSYFMSFYLQVKKDWEILQARIPKEKRCIISCLEKESFNKLICFLIVAEDHRYVYHIGFDLIAILRALIKNILFNKSEGASTIEQQLVRVITGDYRHSLSRKIKEIILAVNLKRLVNKKEIAMIYLNIAYYGTNYQTLDCVLSRFDLTKKNYLTDNVCAAIIARLKYPEPATFNIRRVDQINRRVKHILFLYNKYSGSKFLRL